MTDTELKPELKPENIVDAIGLKCPMPVIKLQQAIRKQPPSTLFAIDFDDPTGQKDLSSWAKVNKHQIIDSIALENGFRMTVKSFADK